MATDVIGAVAVPRQTRPDSTPRPKPTAEGPKKLPRPIVFWSVNEKTAYRRNRVVQTRMNMIMDDIVTQRETCRRWIRYEAHKFRQRSGKYFSHPGAQSSENQGINIAPPGWVDKHLNTEKDEKNGSMGKRVDSDESDSELDEDFSNNELKPRKSGIITQGRKPVVKFTVNAKAQGMPQATKEDKNNLDEERIKARESYIRSTSALQYRETNDMPDQSLKRQKSAFPSFSRNAQGGETFSKQNAEYSKITPIQSCYHDNESSSPRQSDKFFDRSKAAYELRLDLRRQANLRKQGITTALFTIRDALQMEREKFSQSRDKVIKYIDRVEAIKRAERTVINKWNRGEIQKSLNL